MPFCHGAQAGNLQLNECDIMECLKVTKEVSLTRNPIQDTFLFVLLIACLFPRIQAPGGDARGRVAHLALVSQPQPPHSIAAQQGLAPFLPVKDTSLVTLRHSIMSHSFSCRFPAWAP